MMCFIQEIEVGFLLMEKSLDAAILAQFKRIAYADLPAYHFGLGNWI